MDLVQLENTPRTFSPSEMLNWDHGREGHPILGETQPSPGLPWPLLHWVFSPTKELCTTRAVPRGDTATLKKVWLGLVLSEAHGSADGLNF